MWDNAEENWESKYRIDCFKKRWSELQDSLFYNVKKKNQPFSVFLIRVEIFDTLLV